MTPLDRLINAVSPARGHARALARSRTAGLLESSRLSSQMVERMSARYDGASRTHRLAGRVTPSTSADREIWQELRLLRDRSRELVRNNAYAKRAVGAIAANVVGPGIVPSVECDQPRLKTKIEALIKQHLESVDIDLEGLHNLYGLQSLAMRTVVESGEALVVRYPTPSRLRLAVPLQVRVLEPDYLDQLKGTTWGLGAQGGDPIPAGHRVVQGVEFDADGRRCAYWLFKEHPGDGLLVNQLWSHRVPASHVLHIYRVERPGQTRGVPWGASVIVPMWDLRDFEDAEMTRQKIAACFAVFYSDPDNRMTLAGSVGSDGQPITSQLGSPVDMLEPGTITKLPPGADVKFATPPGVHGYEAYVREQKRKIATGFEVPYEVVATDLSQVNFSSGRLGWLEFQRSITQWQWNMIIPQMCEGMAKWFLDAASIALDKPVTARLNWSEPRREMIDPTREIPAMRDAIRAGLTSRAETVRGLGCDPAKIDAEIAADNARSDALGLVFDSDGRVPLQGPRGDANPVDDDASEPTETKPVPEPDPKTTTGPKRKSKP